MLTTVPSSVSSEISGPDTARPTHRERQWWRWLVPSLTPWLWLLILLVLLTPSWRTTMVSADGDACFHWRVGEYMLHTGRIIRSDVFSHTRFGQPVVSKEWLAEILFAGAARLGQRVGLDGLYVVALMAALVIATTFALLHRQLLREGNDLLAATLLVMGAAWASANHWLARPHVFTFLMVMLWHQALCRFERDRAGVRLAIALGTLTLFWVNLHGAFLAGFFVLGVYWAGAVVDWWRVADPAERLVARRKLLALTVAGAACAAVSLVNPSGWQLHAHNLEFLRSKFFTDYLNEYRTVDFQNPMARGFLAWLAILYGTVALVRARFSVTAGLLIVTWTWFALYSARNIALLAIVTAPLLAPVIGGALARRFPRWRSFSERLGRTNAMSRGWPVVILAAVVAALIVPRPTAMPAESWPVRAVEYIQRHPDRFQGPMFNQYGWGGYLMLVLPDHRVFVDGRADFYGEELVREFQQTTSLQPHWQEPLEKYRVAWTLMPADHRLNLALAQRGWTCAFSNEVSVILLKSP